MKYHVIRIMDNDEQQNTRLIYAHADNGDNEILELGVEWMEKNEVEVGSWLVTDEKGYISKYEEIPDEDENAPKDEFKESIIKALLGDYEAKCRIAELLLEAKDYDRNDKAAFAMIEKMYDSIRIDSENNVFNEDFCDIAIRYGDLFYEGIGVRKNKVSAYKCYLEAQTIYNYRQNLITDDRGELGKAIQKRMDRYESEKTSAEYNRIVTKSFVCNYPFFLLDVLSCGTNKYRINARIRRINETDYYMQIVRIGASGSENINIVPRFLLCIPEQELCIYNRVLNLKLRGTRFLSEMPEEFMADSLVYEQSREELTFILNDEEVMKAQINYMEIESS